MKTPIGSKGVPLANGSEQHNNFLITSQVIQETLRKINNNNKMTSITETNLTKEKIDLFNLSALYHCWSHGAAH
eukprot:7576264-Ditylum_brightwellii.AAC.1